MVGVHGAPKVHCRERAFIQVILFFKELAIDP